MCIRYFPAPANELRGVCRLSYVVKNWQDLAILIVHRTRGLEKHTQHHTNADREGATGAADRRPASIFEAERRAQRRRGERPERLDRVALELLEDLDVECEYQVALVHDRLLLRVTQLEQVELRVPGEG